MTTGDKPRVLLKSKNIQLLMEYCIENKLEFTVIPGAVNDEWEVEINIKNLIKAVELGMFMKTNRFELAGAELFPKTPAPKPVKKTKEVPVSNNTVSEIKEEDHKEIKKPEQPALGLDFNNE